MIEIIKGETRLEKISLVNQSNGNPVRLETLTSIKAELYQNLNTFAIYTYPNSYFRLGAAVNELQLEVISEVSKFFLPGIVNLRLTLSQLSLDFPANPYAVDIIDYQIYKVVETQKDNDILVNPITLKTALEAITILLSSETLLSSEIKLSSGRA